MEQTTLYYRQGSSDKVYQASIEPVVGGYVVNTAFGRRGSTLTTRTKTPTAVNYGAARAIYEKLLKEKTAKGYTVGENGVPYQHSEKIHTGIQCQLLNSIEGDQIEKLLTDPAYWMQEKLDGRRLLIEKCDGVVRGINRQGLSVSFPATIERNAADCPLDFTLDGEAIGDTLHVFDFLHIGTEDLRGQGYGERYLRLMNLLASFQHRYLQLVPSHFTTGQKVEALEKMTRNRCEGVVFKHTHEPYTAGRPASGGPQLKYKFCETASFIVGKINAKRSIGLLVFDGDKIKPAGNVTIPANHEIPTTGQVVECRYLYAFQESGSIFQPVYLGVRDDIRAEECIVAQLKYKAEPQEEAA